MNVDDIGADSEGDEDDGDEYEHGDSGDDRDDEDDDDDPDVDDDDDGSDDCGIEASIANGDNDDDKMVLKGMTMMMNMIMTM